MRATDPNAELDQLERALIDVVRGLLGRPFTTVTPSGQRLDKAAYHLLSRLGETGDIRLSDLAALAGLDVSTVSRQVRQLEEGGLVLRRPDPDDGRAARFDLTETGHRDLLVMRRDRQDRLDAATAGWPARDRTHLTELLTRLSAALSPDCAAHSRTHPDRTTREVASA